MRTTAEPITVAYIASGAMTYLRGLHYETVSKIIEDYEGEMNFIDAVIDKATMLDRLADAVSDGPGFAGVYLYEVAEPFGEEYARALGEESLGNSSADADQIAAGLIEAATDHQPEVAR